VLTSCFADQLLAEGYMVYNTGISGSDPPQYLAVGKKYIPQIKPDYVVVNFFLGNDVQYFERKPEAGRPVFYATNYGNLYSCQEGVYYDDPNQVLEVFSTHYQICRSCSSFNHWAARTTISTLAWNALYKKGWVQNESEASRAHRIKADSLRLEVPNANRIMRELEKIAEAHNARLILMIIPELKDGQLTHPKDYFNLFTDQEFFYPDQLTTEDYSPGDGHFNTDGHQKYAKILDRIIKLEHPSGHQKLKLGKTD
jgi:hypothetical protein